MAWQERVISELGVIEHPYPHGDLLEANVNTQAQWTRPRTVHNCGECVKNCGR